MPTDNNELIQQRRKLMTPPSSTAGLRKINFYLIYLFVQSFVNNPSRSTNLYRQWGRGSRKEQQKNSVRLASELYG